MVIGLSLTANCWLFTGFEYRQILPSQLTTSVNHTGGLHTDVYLVGLHRPRDVQIEQYLALVIQLKRRLGNRNSCSLSKDRYVAYRGTNLPSSPFDCRVNMK